MKTKQASLSFPTLLFLALATATFASTGCMELEDDYDDWEAGVERQRYPVESIDGRNCWDVFYYTATCDGVTGRGLTRAAAMESIAEACYESTGGVTFGGEWVTECEPEGETLRIYSKGSVIDIGL